MIKTKFRAYLSLFLSSIPSFKGKGRLTLLLDRILTNYQNPESYNVLGVLNGGVKFIFDLRAWGQKFAYYYRGWESDYVNILRKIYRGGIFLDIGSSLGLYVVCLGDIVRMHKENIVSVEPVSFNLERQMKNVVLNELDDIVTYIPLALGSQKVKLRIITDPNKSDNNAIISNQGDSEVEVVTLDSLVIERKWKSIGLMKIDVEGYEPKVLEGAQFTIEKDKPIIFAEFNRERMKINGFSMDAVWQFLMDDLSYKSYYLHKGDKKLRILEAPGDIENIFFIPEGMILPYEMLSQEGSCT